MQRLKKVLAPPIYRDPKENHIARIYYYMTWLSMLMTVGSTIAQYLSSRVLGQLYWGGLICVLFLVLLFLLKAKQVKWVGYAYPAIYFAILNTASWYSGGIYSPVFAGNLMLVTMAGSILSWRAGLVYFLASAVAGIFFIYAGALDFLPLAYFTFTPPIIGLIYFIFAGSIVLLIFIDITDLRRALGEASKIMHDQVWTEDQLRTSEKKYRALFESTNDGIVFMNEDSVIFEVNASAKEIFGYSDDEMIGMRGFDLLPLDARVLGKNKLKDVLAGERFSIYERNMIRKDGTIFPAEVNLSVFEDDSGVIQAQSVIRDISARKLAEDELRTSEKRYRDLFARAYDGIAMLAADSTILEVNDRGAKMLGYQPSELVGRSATEMILADDMEDATSRLDDAAIGMQMPIYVRKMLHRDGHIVFTEINMSQVIDDDGNLQYILSVYRDITERIHAEETLRKNEERYRALFERTNDAVFIFDVDGRILDANNIAAEMLGYSRAEILENSMSKYIDPAEEAEIRSRAKTLLLGEDLPIYERGFVHRDGTIFTTEVNIALVRDDDGTPLHVQSIVRDISERKETEETLRDNAQKLRAFFDNTDDAVYIKDRDGRYVMINAAGAAMLKRVPTEIIGLKDDGLFSPDDAENIMELDQHVIQSEARTTYESIRQVNGETIYFLNTKIPYLSDENEIVGIIGITRDMSKEKRSEIALREIQERYRSLFNSNIDGVIIVDLDGTIQDVSDRAAEMVGYRSIELIGQSMDILTPDIDVSSSDIQYHDIAEIEKIPIYERLFRRKDGSLFPAEINVGVVYGLDGKPYYVQNIIRDIAERKHIQAERERLLNDLRYRSMQIQTAFEVSKSTSSLLDTELLLVQTVNLIQQRFNYYYVGVFLMDDDGVYAVLKAGSGAFGQQMLEVNHKLTIGSDSMIGWCIENKRARIALDVGNDAIRFENPYLPDTRSELAIPLIFNDDAIGGITVQSTLQAAFTGEDITVLQIMADQMVTALENARLHEQVTAHAEDLERRVQDRTAQLEATNKELESFSYTVSHDLRAPLRAIHGFSGILLSEFADEFSEPAMRFQKMVRDNALKMGALIDDLLAFSRLGRKEVVKQPVNMKALVERVVGELKDGADADAISFDIQPMPIAQGDHTLLRQVYANLIGNAMKFTRNVSQPQVIAGLMDTEKGRAYFVKDNGVGFNMDYADRLFGVFQRLHREEEFEGTGVGLAIVHRVVTRHGGQVWCDAEIDKGATFYFTLPEN